MVYETCPMCGSKTIEVFHNRPEWKTAMICYSCNYVEIKKRFYIKNKEEEEILHKFEEGSLKENKQ